MLLADPVFFAPRAGFLGRYLFGDDRDNTTRTEFDHHSNHEDKIDGNPTPEADVPAKGLHDMKTNDDGAKTPTATDNIENSTMTPTMTRIPTTTTRLPRVRPTRQKSNIIPTTRSRPMETQFHQKPMCPSRGPSHFPTMPFQVDFSIALRLE